MITLRSRLSELAATFADQVIASIQQASLHEIVGMDGAPRDAGARSRKPAAKVRAASSSARMAPVLRPSGRLRHRSAVQIEEAVGRVVALLKSHAGGLRAEEIRVDLGMLSKEMPRVLKEGLLTKKLTSTGHKRATTYFAK
jgi:hypothetical protein